jgi:hypothetical protein
VDDGAASVACADGAFHAACCSRDEAALMLQCYLLRENELLPRQACLLQQVKVSKEGGPTSLKLQFEAKSDKQV